MGLWVNSYLTCKNSPPKWKGKKEKKLNRAVDTQPNPWISIQMMQLLNYKSNEQTTNAGNKNNGISKLIYIHHLSCNPALLLSSHKAQDVLWQSDIPVEHQIGGNTQSVNDYIYKKKGWIDQTYFSTVVYIKL